ncbi:hypothetical protein PASE110613_09265 [Paenibacillus sediminis]|uniref:Uncharacterized protein n=1 Tax=Paenibacillus sediminis TaxID=664909 RepID=A0ABS4H6J2_9BACL|nr:hypothetical protein [Paenibacillus sediminis]MBP1938164.1 hypothetical protein [Paenibacillus sediminis]
MAEVIAFPNEIAAQLETLADRARNAEITGVIVGVIRSDGRIETISIGANLYERGTMITALQDARTVALIDEIIIEGE